MNATSHRPSLSSAVFYRDPRAALEWLERAFGFARCVVVSDAQGRIAHAEMSFGDGIVMIGEGGWSDFAVSPESLDGKNTQCVHVQLQSDIDAHCERARAAGAVILQEPADQFYGDRTYRARDPERHVWTFGQTVRRVSREEAAHHSGLSIEGWR
ncbi:MULTISPECIES: VOC family protein [unclassified Burkholderia]|uniref:VOC family protein n=1 Tax=unclassified Burkholderia TaxID=2613784 RepID=UPI000755F3D1|nr:MULTISPECIES: VOC family protein [unclassified Burkholderia]KVN16838.1 glyoxalase [Burkholderia sp. MSMB1552]KWZ51237.1 glyoxalase [Burkholderia sp. MSMB1588]